jgi:hypothetical protein
MTFQNLFLTFLFPLSLFANIEWSLPSPLSDPASMNGSKPQIVAHPTQPTARAIWSTIAPGQYNLFANHFNGSSWDVATSLASSTYFLSLPLLSSDGSGNYNAIWYKSDGSALWIQAAQNNGSGWSAPQSLQSVGSGDDTICLNLTTTPAGVSVVTWQDTDLRLHGLTFQQGSTPSPYFLSQEGLNVESSVAAPFLALFTSSGEIYGTSFDPTNPPSNPISQNLYPFAVQFPSMPMAFASDNPYVVSVFQDFKSLYLLSGLTKDGINWTHSIVDIPYVSILSIKTALNKKTGKLAAIWQLSNGSVKSAVFNGRKWSTPVILSSNGAAPAIAFNPVNGHVIAVWADLTEGDENNSIREVEFDGTNWSTPISLSDTGATIDEAQISINSKGNAFVIWTRQPTLGANKIVEVVTGS